MNIVLPESGWMIEGNVVTIQGKSALDRFALPRGSRRITVESLTAGRKRLVLGGFKTITVSVCGPSETIDKLREAVL